MLITKKNPVIVVISVKLKLGYLNTFVNHMMLMCKYASIARKFLIFSVFEFEVGF